MRRAWPWTSWARRTSTPPWWRAWRSATGPWLREHAPEYGFILRYMKDKTDITGTSFEPWHYRYVGVEDAQKITAQGVCLEEYLGRTE